MPFIADEPTTVTGEPKTLSSGSKLNLGGNILKTLLPILQIPEQLQPGSALDKFTFGAVSGTREAMKRTQNAPRPKNALEAIDPRRAYHNLLAPNVGPAVKSAVAYELLPQVVGKVTGKLLSKIPKSLPPSLSKTKLYSGMEALQEGKTIPQERIFDRFIKEIPDKVKAPYRTAAIDYINKAITAMRPASVDVNVPLEATKMLSERSSLGTVYDPSSRAMEKIVDRAMKRILSEELKTTGGAAMTNLDRWYGIIAGLEKLSPDLAKQIAKLVGLGVVGGKVAGASLKTFTK